MTAAGRPVTRLALRGFILALLALSASSDDSNCEVGIEVRRHTVYAASAGDGLRVECPVRFCNSTPPTISWYKFENAAVPITPSSRIDMAWRTSGHLEGKSLLIFKYTLVNDSGLYQCKSDSSVSHFVNVSISGNGEPSSVTGKPNTNTATSDRRGADLWLYAYTAAGIVAFVVVVIVVSVASLRGCKGQAKNGTRADNQYMAIPMADQRRRPRAPPGGSPSAPPSWSSSRRKKTAPSQGEEPPRHKEQIADVAKEDGQRQGSAEEEGSAIVYAALDHQPAAGAAARPRRPQEEGSEYAAIRLRD